VGVADEVVGAGLVVVGVELVKGGIATSAWALARTEGESATNTAAPIAVVINTHRVTRAAVVPTRANATS
jgi:hypothetical protein